MAEVHDRYGMILQNLLDAGCGGELTGRCMQFALERNYAKILPLLSQHRNDLLAAAHKCYKQIDCLDYLIYKIKKELD